MDKESSKHDVGFITNYIKNNKLLIRHRESCISFPLHVIKAIIFVCILAGSTIGVFTLLTGSPNPLKLFGHTEHLDPIKIEEKWETNGTGLELFIENALDDHWTFYFEEYITKWNEGEPDSLSLKISRVEIDKECNPTTGRLKVCNGDYGHTNWEGINTVLVHENRIIWSTSKMNDYFLRFRSDLNKRYAMCHELGHGFGLPHTDEDYNNVNRGDCMDYTHHYEGNLSPGGINFKILAQSYGIIPPKRRFLQESGIKEDIEKGGKIDDEDQVPQNIIDTYNDSVEKLGRSEQCNDDHCVEHLGGGFKVIFHKLLV